MTRICSGRFKGFTLHIPGGRDIRPTGSMVREAVFSIIGDKVQQARVLDLYAGSGALGLEALSRGANYALFCDVNGSALKALRQNLARLPEDLKAELKMARWPKFSALAGHGPFNLVFIDPPYKETQAPLTFLKLALSPFQERTQKKLANPLVPETLTPSPLMAPDALAVWEQAPETLKLWNEENIYPWTLIQVRRWGGTAVAFLALDNPKE